MTLGCLPVLPRGTRGFKVLESRTVCTESESQVPPSSLPLRKHLHNHLPQQLQGGNGGARQNILSVTALEKLRRAPPRPWSLAALRYDAGPAGWAQGRHRRRWGPRAMHHLLGRQTFSFQGVKWMHRHSSHPSSEQGQVHL